MHDRIKAYALMYCSLSFKKGSYKSAQAQHRRADEDTCNEEASSARPESAASRARSGSRRAVTSDESSLQSEVTLACV